MSSAYLEHPITKQIKEAPVGNWNFMVLFFSAFVPLMRGDFKWTCLLWIPPIWLIGVNKYNFWYIKDLLKEGYKIKTLPPTMTPEMLSMKIGMNAKDFML